MVSHQRITEIEYLRALAIVMTIAAHANFVTNSGDSGYQWFTQKIGHLWGGVDLFFCISGFVISRQLVPDLTEGLKRGRHASVLMSFYTRRAYRILPLATAWATFVMVLSLVLNASGSFGKPMQNFGSYIASLLFVENIYLTTHLHPQFSIYWSLSIEEQFYLVFPLILIIVPRHRLFFAVIALIAMQFFLPRPVDQSNLLSMVRYDALLMGVAVYLWTLTNSFKMQPRQPVFLRVLAAALLAAVILIPVQARSIWFFTGLLDACAAGIVAIAALEAGTFRFSASWLHRATMWIGRRSYGLYLSHMPLVFLWKEIATRSGLPIVPDRIFDVRTALYLALVCLVTELCARWIEEPLRRKGVAIAKKFDQTQLSGQVAH